ncbi:hypothetical protein ACRRS0_21470 [Agarivorans sp. QJM3NY_29]|uniref:hypothetical protein n=1 Tax=unclassified Agarivorans TaxID=2636026 RepID=UPI003D7C4BB9
MIELFKNKYVFMLSSVVASGTSYFLNITLILLLADKSQYANYLSLNAWAIYLSTFIYLSIMELYISPEGKSVDISKLFNTSFFTLVALSFIIIFLYFLAGSNYLSFSIITTSIFYAFIKLLAQYFLFRKQTEGVVFLRYGRSLLIIIMVFILYLVKNIGEVIVTSEDQLYIQGGICALVICFAIFIFNIKFYFNEGSFFEIYRNFKGRIVKRNFSMLFDMIHMPILYHVISHNSNLMNATFIYAVGVVLPLAYVVSVILKEQVIVKLNGGKLSSVDRISKMMIFVVLFFYVFIMAIHSYDEYYQLTFLILLGSLITFSGCVGLNIYRKGLEKYDLANNLFVMVFLLLISNSWIDISPQMQVILSIFIVSLKFTVQLLLSLFGKEKVGCGQ